MMHGSSKQRLKYSFVGSLLFHILLIVVLALTGLFALNKNDDRILEVAVFGGGGGGGFGGGGGGGGGGGFGGGGGGFGGGGGGTANRRIELQARFNW